MWLYWRLFLVGLGILGRRRRDLILENLTLRQQLAVWERSGRRPRLQTRDRRFWSVTARNWVGWRAHLQLVQPATMIGWHRFVWRRYWRWKSRGGQPGRVPIDLETRRLIDRLATENPTWGVRRIAAELAVLGHPVSPTTVHRYRRIRPEPSPTWRTFLRLHAPEIWAADFFTVQTLTLRTFYVFFVISHDRRRIMHWNVTAHPTAPWVWRQIIAATPWNTAPRFLIRDQDRSYGGDFVPRAAALGIETVLTPVRAPKANAIAERVIGTIPRDCLDHLIVLTERHLRRILREYVASWGCKTPSAPSDQSGKTLDLVFVPHTHARHSDQSPGQQPARQ
jgi:transposase InsO family protein